MDNFEKKKQSFDSRTANVTDAASELIQEGKKLASELYEEGLNKVHDAQKNVKEYSDEVLEKVRKNPMTSVLIAAGVGFLLSALLRK
ncbi:MULTISPECIES: ElaB/YgaM/YqjD family protein [Legionella]|uniref:DUF883 family protein n=1 Tax=Legionella TaxID=445 RepID=UPI000F8F5970|nr:MULTISPECIES: hypothetical protein [Legionella]MCP0914827.1 hypothetical protein [Legionella sp. 27cVA30]RUR11491.1 hypothetical protein ELY14_01730 [Legionella septentrionalis]